MILLLLLYAVCATTFTLSKAALSVSTPLAFLAARMLAGGAVLVFASMLWYGTQSRPRTREALWYTSAIGLWGILVSYLLDLWSLQYMSSTLSAYLYGLTPFITGIVSYVVLYERLTLLQVCALCIAFAGNSVLWQCVLCDMGPLNWYDVLPVLAVIGAMAASSYGWVLMRKAVTTTTLPVLVLNGWSMIFGGIGAAVLQALVGETGLPITSDAWSKFLTITALIILASNVIFSNLYGYLLRTYSATFVALAGVTCPLWAFLFGWLFLGESLPLTRMLIATVCLALGLLLFYLHDLTRHVPPRTRSS